MAIGFTIEQLTALTSASATERWLPGTVVGDPSATNSIAGFATTGADRNGDGRRVRRYGLVLRNNALPAANEPTRTRGR